MFQLSSKRIGSFEGLTPDGLMLGKEWQENDGLVNTISAMAPDYAPQKSYTDALALEKGVWYIMPTYVGDHMSFQGGFTIKNNITDFYTKHLCLINQL